MTELARGTSQTSQTSAGVSDTAYAGWLTKAEAATAIGVTTKTVERLAADGRIQQGAAQRQGRGPTLAVYHPDDVARVAQDRRQSPAAFVLPAGVTSPVAGNGHQPGTTALSQNRDTSTGEDLLRGFMGAILRAVSEKSETPPPTLFLSLDEAAAVSGLSTGYLRRVIKAGTLPAVRNRGWKIRRRDLEAL